MSRELRERLEALQSARRGLEAQFSGGIVEAEAQVLVRQDHERLQRELGRERRAVAELEARLAGRQQRSLPEHALPVAYMLPATILLWLIGSHTQAWLEMMLATVCIAPLLAFASRDR